MEQNGTSKWDETHTNVILDKGIYSILLGSVATFPADLFHDDERWLEVTEQSLRF